MNAQNFREYLESRRYLTDIDCDSIEMHDEPTTQDTEVQLSSREQFLPVFSEILGYIVEKEIYLDEIAFDYENNIIHIIGG